MSPENKAITYSALKYIIWIILAVTPVIVTWVTIENRITNVESRTLKCDTLEDRIIGNDIKYAEIKASLEWIKVTQQDILARLQR